MLELRNINIDPRIFNVSALFDAGKKYAIVGINGAGKTSLLDVISAKLSGKNIMGEVLLDGKNAAEFNPKGAPKNLLILRKIHRFYSITPLMILLAWGFIRMT